MALDKPGLVLNIKQLLSSMRNMTDSDFENHQEYFANGLADAIDVYVRTGTVITVGNSTTQTGNIT